jgi:Skp family chaperone for outer membrane proteins
MRTGIVIKSASKLLKTWLTLLPVAIVLVALADLANAQGKLERNPVIAVLDVQKVMRDAKAAKAIRRDVNAQRKKIEAQIGAEREKLKAEEQKLRQQRSILAPDAIAQKQRELERRYGELRRRADRAGGGFNRAVSTAMAKLNKEMGNIVARVMKEKGVNITLARDAVLVFDDKLNITSEIVTRLDKKVPRIKVDFEAASRKPAPKKR